MFKKFTSTLIALALFIGQIPLAEGAFVPPASGGSGDISAGGTVTSNSLHLNDDLPLSLGNTDASPDYRMLWETADANANAILHVSPEGGATNIPVHIFGDASALNVDLGLFDGRTAPAMAVLSDDHLSYTLIDHNETDSRIINNEGDILITAAGGNFNPSASDGAALGSSTLMWSDLFLASGAVTNWNNGDVTLTHSADTLSFASGFYNFDNRITLTKSAGSGSILSANVSSTVYNNGGSTIDVVRSGNLTGVASEYLAEFEAIPAFTLTEPGSGSFSHYAANLDLSNIAVTAGAGTSELAALRLVANADADVGTNWALFVDAGRSRFDDAVTFGAGVAVVAADYSIGRDADGTNQLHLNVPTGATIELSVNDIQEFVFSTTSLDLRSNDIRWTANGSVTASATQIIRSSAVLNYNNGTGAIHRFSLNNVAYFTIGDNTVNVVAARFHMAKGADVASANDMTLGSDGNSFDITGTNTINTISATGWTAGDIIYLQFDAGATVADNTAGTGAVILLAGSANFTASADDMLTLWYNGTAWVEVSRSAN